jgi:ferritin-like metal-binding protein YciE
MPFFVDGRARVRSAGPLHEAETEDQVGRLEQVFAAIDKKPPSKTCAAIVGITDERAEIMKKYKDSPAHDSGLLAAAQAVEHEELGREDAASLSQETLEEEKAIPPSALGRRAPGRLSSPGPGIPLGAWGAILGNAGKLSPLG